MQSVIVGGNSSDASGCMNGTAQVEADSPVLDSFNSNFNLLYSLYAWPNTLLPFFGGYIADRLGMRLMGVVFMGLIAAGTLVVAFGSSLIASNPNAAWYIM